MAAAAGPTDRRGERWRPSLASFFSFGGRERELLVGSISSLGRPQGAVRPTAIIAPLPSRPRPSDRRRLPFSAYVGRSSYSPPSLALVALSVDPYMSSVRSRSGRSPTDRRTDGLAGCCTAAAGRPAAGLSHFLERTHSLLAKDDAGRDSSERANKRGRKEGREGSRDGRGKRVSDGWRLTHKSTIDNCFNQSVEQRS